MGCKKPLQNDHKNPYIQIYGSSKEPYIRIYEEGLALTSNIPIFDISWYRSTVTRPTDIVMNQVPPVAKEAPVTFGHVKSQIYMDIYNTCISYPTATILLGLADVKACYQYPSIHTDLTGAFGFIAD
jgi:hypothetical protein